MTFIVVSQCRVLERVISVMVLYTAIMEKMKIWKLVLIFIPKQQQLNAWKLTEVELKHFLLKYHTYINKSTIHTVEYYKQHYFVS